MVFTLDLVSNVSQKLNTSSNTLDCCVYWIHLKDSKDILTEGYVGVSRDFLRRMDEHKNSKSKSSLLNKGLNINKDNLVYEIIFEGCEKDCYEMEWLLRPSYKIGWNIDTGGNSKGKCLSEIHSSMFKTSTPPKRCMEDYMLLNDERSRYYKYILNETGKASPQSELHRLKFRARKRLKSIGQGSWVFSTNKKIDYWLIADEIHESWVRDNYPSDRRLIHLLQIKGRPHSISNIIKEFREGWVPQEDKRWLLWKEKEQN